MSHAPRLLLFNLMTDDADPVLGFASGWIRELAARCEYVDVITMYQGSYQPPANVRVFSAGRERGLSKAARLTRFYRQLARLLSTRRYDACFAHMMPLFAGLAGPLADGARHTDNAVVHAPAAVGAIAARAGAVTACGQRGRVELSLRDGQAARPRAWHRHRLLRACPLRSWRGSPAGGAGGAVWRRSSIRRPRSRRSRRTEAQLALIGGVQPGCTRWL